MKNLLDENVKKEIISRIDKLSPTSKALWGKMNVNQGLRHMSMSLDIPTGNLNPTLGKVPPLPKWLMKFFLLNAKIPKEKGVTFSELNTVSNNINPDDFESEKELLKKQLEQFYSAPTLIPENKLGGKFSKKDWGKLNYNHMDHHLRQFGA